MTNTVTLATTQSEPPPVTLLTALATAVDLPAAEYRALYDRLRESHSLRQVTEVLHSAVTFGWWAKYEQGKAELTAERKNELRHAHNLPDLPPAPAMALAAGLHPDAAVWKIGREIGTRAVIIGADVPSLVLSVNGEVRVSPLEPSAAPALESPVVPCIARYMRPKRSSIVVSKARWDRLNAARLRAGLTWEQFTERWEE